MGWICTPLRFVLNSSHLQLRLPSSLLLSLSPVKNFVNFHLFACYRLSSPDLLQLISNVVKRKKNSHPAVFPFSFPFLLSVAHFPLHLASKSLSMYSSTLNNHFSHPYEKDIIIALNIPIVDVTESTGNQRNRRCKVYSLERNFAAFPNIQRRQTI